MTDLRIHLALFSYGGLVPETFDAAVVTLLAAKQFGGKLGIEMGFTRVSQDALIDRSRSRAATDFLKDESQGDVLFMLDHDIGFEAPALYATAEKAHRHQAIVGGLYPFRSPELRWSSRPHDGAEFVRDSEGLAPAEFIAGGFLAIPRPALQKIWLTCGKENDAGFRIETVSYHPRPFIDFFRPFVMTTKKTVGAEFGVGLQREYLSEDWAFSARASRAGVNTFVDMDAQLIHYGQHGYTRPTR